MTEPDSSRLVLDHVHIRVPDRAVAAEWYATHLGFEPVEEYRFWATGFDALRVEDVRDFDLCWAFDLADPWGHQYELNCYDHETVRHQLVEVDGVVPVR
jgi:catechol 2,3-dioxygenase-like lactoylglutathione lyase family enzyme